MYRFHLFRAYEIYFWYVSFIQKVLFMTNATLTPSLPTAKVFTTGRSQAVRLPKAFRFSTKEVTVEKVGDAVVLRPKFQTKDEWWAQMEKVLAAFDGMEPVERTRGDLRDPVSFD
jgi:antitoxin VapB